MDEEQSRAGRGAIFHYLFEETYTYTREREIVARPQSKAASAAASKPPRLWSYFVFKKILYISISICRIRRRRLLIRLRRCCLRRRLPEPGARNFNGLPAEQTTAPGLKGYFADDAWTPT